MDTVGTSPGNWNMWPLPAPWASSQHGVRAPRMSVPGESRGSNVTFCPLASEPMQSLPLWPVPRGSGERLSTFKGRLELHLSWRASSVKNWLTCIKTIIHPLFCGHHGPVPVSGGEVLGCPGLGQTSIPGASVRVREGRGLSRRLAARLEPHARTT